MKVAEFEALVKSQPAAKRVELPPEDYKDLAADLWPGLNPLEFIYEGITVAPGYPGIVSLTAPSWHLSWSVDRPAAKVCDCGAAKTNQPGHSYYCSTLVSA